MKTHNATSQYVLVVCPNPSVDIWAWLDKFQLQQTNRITREEHYPGGKGVHVAMALAELGHSVHLLGFWAGPTGKWIRDECKQRYPAIHCIGPTVQGWSRSCYTLQSDIDDKTDDTELLGTGPDLSEEDIKAFDQTFDQEVAQASCVVMSGSWPRKAPDNGYAQLIHQTHAHKKSVFLDCTGVQLTHALNQKPFCVHLNRSEATQLYDTDELTETIPMLLSHCDWAAITDGSRGLWLADNQQVVHGQCAPKRVYSAVGSGDCLVAGLADAFVKKMDISSAAQLGVACGAANCQHPELGIIRKEDVAELSEKAQVTLAE